MALFSGFEGAMGRWVVVSNYLKPFLEENGWTIDLYTANSRIHFSNPNTGQHYDCVSGTSTPDLNIAACLGYNSGAAYNAQPGHLGVTVCRLGTYGATDFSYFYNCGNDIHNSLLYNGSWNSNSFFHIENKIANWAGGQGLAAASLGSGAGILVNVDGVGRVGYGTHGNTPLYQGPMEWNRSSYLVPVLMCVNDWVETSANKIPVGYLSDMYSCSPGSDFLRNEIVTINGNDHIWAVIGTTWCLVRLRARP